MAQAKAWYNSSENAEARDVTPNAFKGRVLMFVEGVKVRRPMRFASPAGDQGSFSPMDLFQ